MAVLALLALSVPAWAGSILDMPVGKGGRVVYGTKGPRSVIDGFGISINDLILGSRTLDILGGHFAFSTGRFADAQGSTLVYSPGGKFTLRGCVDGNGDHDRVCDKKDIRGVLMTGTFLNAKLLNENGKTILVAQFMEQINPALAALLKLPTESEGVLELILTGTGSHRGWTIDTVAGGSLALLSEPGSLLTLGTSLVGLLLILRSPRLRRRFS